MTNGFENEAYYEHCKYCGNEVVIDGQVARGTTDVICQGCRETHRILKHDITSPDRGVIARKGEIVSLLDCAYTPYANEIVVESEGGIIFIVIDDELEKL